MFHNCEICGELGERIQNVLSGMILCTKHKREWLSTCFSSKEYGAMRELAKRWLAEQQAAHKKGTEQ